MLCPKRAVYRIRWRDLRAGPRVLSPAGEHVRGNDTVGVGAQPSSPAEKQDPPDPRVVYQRRERRVPVFPHQRRIGDM